ncbi:MAG: head GIN domain-containing protein [Candidatus Eisenbacteria bacterium]
MRSMRFLLTAMCAGIILLEGACSFQTGGGGVKGSGVVQIEPRPVSRFTRIDLAGSGDVIVKQTGRESLTVRAEDNILPLLDTHVSNLTLSLGSSSSSYSTTRGVQYLVEVKQLEGLSVSGSGSIEAQGIECGTITIVLSGSGNISISGSADALDLSIPGSGNYNGQNFRARRAVVEISGSGNIIVNATDQLDGRVSGSGSIRYIGTPEVRSSVTGSGSVSRF